MADPIPSADSALLAAQAKAGQAGVDAYQAAKQELMNQRQQAVQQAMQEAALRGAPAGAVGSIQSTITAPYDQAIANMTQGSANYQTDMAARDRRVADYGSATQMARSLIPGQVEMAVAPIRAENDYRLRSQQLAGDRSIAEIQANTELEKARLSAAIEAAKRKAEEEARKQAAEDAKKAAEDAKLNQSQLGGILDPRVADLLTSTSSSVEDMLAANVQQRRNDAWRQSGLTPGEEQQASAANANATNARLAAAYGGRGLAQAKTNQFAAAAGASVPQAIAPPRPPSAGPTLPQTGFPSMQDVTGGAAQLFSQTPEQLSANRLPATSALARPPSPAEVAAGRVAALQSAASPSPAVTDQQQQYQAMRDAVPSAVAPAAQFGLQRLLRPMQALNATANNNTVLDPASGNRLGITPEQLAGLTPEQRVMLLGGGAAGGDIVTPGDFESLVMGNPTRDIERQLAGQPNSGAVSTQASSDAVRAAYQLIFGQLQNEGTYNIGLKDLAAAMPDKVPSIYDYLQSRSGLPTATDQYAGAVKDQAAGVQAQASQLKQADADADSVLADRYGVSVQGSDIGTPSSVLDFITGSTNPATKAQFDEAQAAVQQLSDPKFWVDNYQDDQGDFTTQKLRRVLQTYTSPMGSKLTPRAISIALKMLVG